MDNELRMRWMQATLDGIIAISSYLEHYYQGRGRKVLRVPVLVDLEEPQWALRQPFAPDRDGSLTLAFVGNAGKKDNLISALRGLALAGHSAKVSQIIVAGPTQTQVAESLGGEAHLLETLRTRLRFTGRLPHREALGHLARADLSILLRPSLRYAQAGFPTKLVESLAMGVPVICNLTSDIGMYVHDGREGIVVRDSSPAAFAEGLRRASALSPEQRGEMRHQARRRAERSFDYRNWVQSVRNFMARVLAPAGAPLAR
jgi:glycosyltransferase involved in cell wall biosynthesis